MWREELGFSTALKLTGMDIQLDARGQGDDCGLVIFLRIYLVHSMEETQVSVLLSLKYSGPFPFQYGLSMSFLL